MVLISRTFLLTNVQGTSDKWNVKMMEMATLMDKECLRRDPEDTIAASVSTQPKLNCKSPFKSYTLQWSAVRVTAVAVTVGYSDSFCNP